MTARFTEREIEDLKARHPCAAVAGEWVKLKRLRSRKGFTQQGPCIACSSGTLGKGDARAAYGVNTWACAACGGGGDLIALWAARHGLDAKRDFVAIVEQLGGVRAVTETAATAERAGRRACEQALARAPALLASLPRSPVPQDFAEPSLAAAWRKGWDKAQRAVIYAAEARERERKRLYENYWQKALLWHATPVETYLTRRGLLVPPHAQLRYITNCPFFQSGDEQAEVIYRGPAMLAAIRDAHGVFRGLHFTWIDVSDAAADRRFKALIIDPATGVVLKSKKSRGSKQGGYLDLGCVYARGLGGFTPRVLPAPHRQFSGEGLESTLAVYTAMVKAKRNVTGIAWRAGIDLGNLTGAALDSARHPTLKDKAGRSRNVPGRTPDLASPAMPIIPGCRDYVQIADGDSDAFTTQCAMARGEARRKAEGVPVRTIWPPADTDFNDWLLKARDVA